ncbi:MAG: DUF4124 domain-containing protein [Cellvibrionaceae bacterium]
MKLIVKFFCFLLVLGFAGLFVLKKPDGTPWLSLDDFIPDISVGSVKDALPGGNEVAVYRWKDAEGNWQYSDTPPGNNTAEQVLVNTNLNRDLVPEFKPSKVADTKPKSGKALLIKDSSISPTTVPMDKIPELVDDAKNVQQLMDDRTKQLEKAMGN